MALSIRNSSANPWSRNIYNIILVFINILNINIITYKSVNQILLSYALYARSPIKEQSRSFVQLFLCIFLVNVYIWTNVFRTQHQEIELRMKFTHMQPDRHWMFVIYRAHQLHLTADFQQLAGRRSRDTVSDLNGSTQHLYQLSSSLKNADARPLANFDCQIQKENTWE